MITQDENNLRFFVPIFSLLTLIFLILSLNKIQKINHKETTLKQVIYLELLYNIIAIFSFQSFILMPDFSLLTSLSISLFLCLKIIDEYNFTKKIPILSVILLGIISGFGFNSKYHMLPIIFLIIITLVSLIKLNKINLFYFTTIFIISFLVASFPTLYWNYKNNFISFLFQLNHGYGSSDYSIKNMGLFIIESSIYITPIIFFYSIKKILNINKNYHKLELNDKLILLALSPICGLFIIFFVASIFDYVAPYWISPVFLLVLPFMTIEMSNWKFNKIFIPLFLIFTILIPSLISNKDFRKNLIYISNGNVGYKLFFWYVFTDSKIENLSGIKIPKSITPKELAEKGCKNGDYIITSLNWTWTSQLAYHFKEHPFIFNLNTDQKSFYSFRDDINNIKNCKIILITTDKLMEDYLYQFTEIKNLTVIRVKEFDKKEEYGRVNILTGIYQGIDINQSMAEN